MVTDMDIILIIIKDLINIVVDKYLSLIQKALLIGSGAFCIMIRSPSVY